MRQIILLTVLLLGACTPEEGAVEVDTTKHVGLTELEADYPFKVLYSTGQIEHAQRQAALVGAAYDYLGPLIGPKEDFFLLVVSKEDWARNADFPVVGMPSYYQGNLIVGAGENDLAAGYEDMIRSFPPEMTTELIQDYTNEAGAFDMKLFFDKQAVHELTHCFQDPKNATGFSMSRWLEEIHANMGLYAFYKHVKPAELKYITSLVDFSLENPPPDLPYTSLADFDEYYYDMSPPNYGHYQMKFTKLAQEIIDALGPEVLTPLNKFLIKYDSSWKEKLSPEAFAERLSAEVDPLLAEVMEHWED